MSSTTPNYITATGNIGTANGGEIDTVVVSPAAATATLTLRESGSGGTVILVLQAGAAGSSVILSAIGLVYAGQLHATLAGAGASAMIAL